MAPPADRRSPLAVALEWVSRITAVAFVMVLPGLGGYFLDQKFETSFLAPVGFVLGAFGGTWSLLALTGAVGKPRGHARKNRTDQHKQEPQK